MIIQFKKKLSKNIFQQKYKKKKTFIKLNFQQSENSIKQNCVLNICD